MQKIQAFQQLFTIQPLPSLNISQFHPPIPKKSKDKDFSKENESKHMNAIKPYIASGANNKQRKISKRQSHKNIPNFSPYPYQNNSSISNSGSIETIAKSKSKKCDKNDSGVKRLEESGIGKNVGQLYNELIMIKSEYKTLKNSYTGLIKQNSQLTERGDKQVNELRKQLQKIRRQEEKQRKQTQFMSEQIQRIKKQCIKMIQTEKNRSKKLEQTIQQKELMIAYLRSQLSVLNQQTNSQINGFYFQHTAPTKAKTHAPSFSLIPSNRQSQPIAENVNLSIIYNAPQHHNFSKVKSSLPITEAPHTINQSVISSIQNNSAYGISECIDLPRQIGLNNNFGMRNKGRVNESMANQESSRNSIIRNRREYVFSNEDDSLSFSYQKSKSSIIEQEQSKHAPQESVSSLNDPSILTFTKKDVYILDEESGNRDTESNPSSHQNRNHNAEQVSSYTGEEDLMTFENRFERNAQKVHQHLERPKAHKNNEFKGKNNSKGISEGKYGNKSKQNTKRLQILTDEMSLGGEQKQYSAETKKRPITHGPSNSKTGKKKLSQKRTSSENNSSVIKK